MESGVTTVWGCGSSNGKEEVFSSRIENINVIRLKAGKAGKLHVRLNLEETPGRKGMHFDHNLDSAFCTVNSAAEQGWLTYHAKYRFDSGGYDGLARVLPRGGNMICDGYGLEITDADEILILLRITPWEEALTAPTKASVKNY